MKNKKIVKVVALVLAFVSSNTVAKAAQMQPAKYCLLSQIDVTPWPPGPEPRLAEVVAKHAAWLFNCGDQKGCFLLPAAKGTPDLVGYQQGQWTCGYEEDRAGGGPAWIRSDALRPITFSINPPVGAWVGIWVGGEDRVTIRRGRAPNELLIDGSARWVGQFTDHFGGVRGTAFSTGNRLMVSDRYGCKVYMTLMGQYINAWDNNECGGMNVNFAGLWKRVSR